MLLTLTSPLSLYSIPVIWFSAFYPNTLKFLLIDKTLGYDNTLPRGNPNRLAAAESKREAATPSEVSLRAQRMDGAHMNGNENFPLWVAAILAGNLVGLDNYTLNTVSIAYVATRLLYNHIYINHNTVLKGWLRTIVFFSGLCMFQFSFSSRSIS
ncbi:hypothetical protein HGRIS_011829 [Hohenbuehelia grisea]|uniref:MAPEG family protein n=1 Tax=Hohenbuehelia grisea TaxID=104357 RepID=A0ABR3JXQ7_9AGAR